MKNLNEQIEKYFELQKQAEEIKAQLDEIKIHLVEEFHEEGIDSYATDKVVATITPKTTFKYNDEPAMVKYLKENGMSQYIVEKIDSTRLNKVLKSSVSLNEALKPQFTMNTSYALSVKEVKIEN